MIYSSFINFLFFIIFKFTEYSLYNFRYASYYTVNCAFYQTTILDSLYCKTIQYSLVSSSFCGPFLCDFSYGCMCDYRDFETVLYFDCFCEIWLCFICFHYIMLISSSTLAGPTLADFCIKRYFLSHLSLIFIHLFIMHKLIKPSDISHI